MRRQFVARFSHYLNLVAVNSVGLLLQRAEYPLEMIEKSGVPLDWRVEKMRLSKDKSQIIYNDFLTLSGIPAEAFEYRLGNRPALEWVIDQYQVSTDKRSGVTNDPNRTALAPKEFEIGLWHGLFGYNPGSGSLGVSLGLECKIVA